MTGARTPQPPADPLSDPEAYPLAGASAQAQRRATPAVPQGPEAGPPAGASAQAQWRATPPARSWKRREGEASAAGLRGHPGASLRLGLGAKPRWESQSPLPGLKLKLSWPQGIST